VTKIQFFSICENVSEEGKLLNVFDVELNMSEEFEDTIELIRIHKSKSRHQNGQKVQKDKQRSTKHTH
jgi:hypothetical protein